MATKELVERPGRDRGRKVASAPFPEARSALVHGLTARGKRAANWSAPLRMRQVVWVVSLLGLIAAIGVLVWGLYGALSYTLTHTGLPCTDPPQRVSSPSQITVVLVCLAAYVVGHLTARWQFIDPAKTHATIGEDSRRRQALLIQALLLIFLLEVGGLLIIEATTLSKGVWPITYYVRCAYDAAGTQSMWAASAILFLVGRWFWLPARRSHAATHS